MHTEADVRELLLILRHRPKLSFVLKQLAHHFLPILVAERAAASLD